MNTDKRMTMASMKKKRVVACKVLPGSCSFHVNEDRFTQLARKGIITESEILLGVTASSKLDCESFRTPMRYTSQT